MKCKTTNWSAFHDGLKRRGLLSIWPGSEMDWTPSPSVNRGGQRQFCVTTIQACLPLKSPVRSLAKASDQFCEKPVVSGRLGLGGAEFEHPVPPPRNTEYEPALSWRHRSCEPAD